MADGIGIPIAELRAKRLAREAAQASALQIDTKDLKKQIQRTNKALERLEGKTATKHQREGINQSARVLLRATKAAAPKVNSSLRNSLAVVVRNYQKGRVYVGVVGQNLKKTRYAKLGEITNKRKRYSGGGISATGRTVPDHLVAGLVGRHNTNARRGARVYNVWEGNVIRGGVNHPGHPENNFYERAFNQSFAQAQAVMKRITSAGVDREAKANKVAPT